MHYGRALEDQQGSSHQILYGQACPHRFAEPCMKAV